MTAQIELLATAIVTSLNTASPLASLAFTASWTYDPAANREDLATLLVQVVPRGETSVRDSRSTWVSDYRIDVGVRKLVDNDTTTPSGLAALTEAIFDFFKNTKPAGRNEVLFGREWNDVLASQQLDEARLFGNVQTLVFRSWRE